MKQENQTLLIHAGCIALIALCVWLSMQIKGDSDMVLEARAMLIGAAVFLYGKLGFKPAGPILDRIMEKIAAKDPERVKRLTERPAPPAPPGSIAPVEPQE